MLSSFAPAGLVDAEIAQLELSAATVRRHIERARALGAIAFAVARAIVSGQIS